MREKGYYWIQRNEPDGPPFWEPAYFDPQSFVSHDPKHGTVTAPMWFLIGHSKPCKEVLPPWSNAWKIGPKIELPQ